MQEIIEQIAENLSVLNQKTQEKKCGLYSDEAEYYQTIAFIARITEHELDEMVFEDKINHPRLKVLLDALNTMIEKITDKEVLKIAEKLSNSQLSLAGMIYQTGRNL